MTENPNNGERRNALKTMFKAVGGLFVGGATWGSFVEQAKAQELILRPPGAIDEKDFLKACTKCGECVQICPYDTLKLASIDDEALMGTPYFNAREIPCYMCPDIVCATVCAPKALDITKLYKNTEENDLSLDVNKSKMGVAIIDQENCLAFWGIQCDACFRACPLIDKALIQEYSRNERTGAHAKLTPKVDPNFCTGCGICEHVCITERSSIKVLPTEVALGKVSDHYIKGWDKNDEKRMRVKDEKPEDKNVVPAEDYLNDWEDLLND
ncbi:MAG: ferredoxin-type protein NapG [Bacteroidetes bacterium]|jgi:ferredoxin-type protein NapG|nr:ferredoxin-type protein NapG [Bacteroidota bacterium]MBT6687840.1 ferredoxin-type protein NapG [Bacteroidota bacterium]MBT7142092.1 ferredoxin-type protein NapG [Bacteroidota bacterium]MBT7492363.1 ferredoxin-type protein NapG [Bacteroidota bacterium]